MENQNILIKSETIAVSASISNIDMSANKDMTVYTGGKILFTTGKYGNTDPKNNFTVQSQNIVLGYPKNSTIKEEAVVKSDQLINVLNDMLSIISDIAKDPQNPNGPLAIGQIEILKKQLYKVKSQTTKTY